MTSARAIPTARQRGGVALPCLYSHNSDKGSDEPSHNKLRGSHKKGAEVLQNSVQALVNAYGIENVAFLTLTFKREDGYADMKEANRKFDNLRRRKLTQFEPWGGAVERQTDEAIHYHLIIHVGRDIRTGFDWDTYLKACDLGFQVHRAKKTGQAGLYRKLKARHRKLTAAYSRSATPYLRQLWAFWREACENYGFGRSECVPVRSNAEAIGKYVGKYISKNIAARSKKDVGKQLLRGSKDFKNSSQIFMWNTPRTYLWRKKTEVLGMWIDEPNILNFGRKLGPRWAFHLQDAILSIDLTKRKGGFLYPSAEHAIADGHEVNPKHEGPIRIECKGWEDGKSEIVIEEFPKGGVNLPPRGDWTVTDIPSWEMSEEFGKRVAESIAKTREIGFECQKDDNSRRAAYTKLFKYLRKRD